MKSVYLAATVIISFFIAIFSAGCKKNCSNPEPVTLNIRMDDNNGEDTYVYKLDSKPNSGNENQSANYDLPAAKWTEKGSPVIERSFLKFNTLSHQIKPGSTINSATLYLYGVTSSPTVPQGNSSYPGSPYNSFGNNESYIRRVVSDWNESTITWNNQPPIINVNQVDVPASDSQWSYDVALNVTSLVQDMFMQPNTNFGFCLMLKKEIAYRSIVFAGSENADSTKRPKLVVTYTRK
jgi:hypothetical protein